MFALVRREILAADEGRAAMGRAFRCLGRWVGFRFVSADLPYCGAPDPWLRPFDP